MLGQWTMFLIYPVSLKILETTTLLKINEESGKMSSKANQPYKAGTWKIKQIQIETVQTEVSDTWFYSHTLS